jgi:XTP/dITP diphosphohydrolase
LTSDEKKGPKSEAPSLKPGVRRAEPEDQHAVDVGPRTSDIGHRPFHFTLFLASSNPGKLREFSEAAAARGVKVEPLPGFAEMPVCVEDGSTFEENARKKAVHYSREVTGWVFADDSGICVDSLDGVPGVHSARFAGPQASDEQNNQRLVADLHRIEAQHGRAASKLEKASGASSGLDAVRPYIMDMEHARSTAPQGLPRPNRAAHYVCVIALAEAGKLLTVTEGRVDGVIIDEPRGEGGFGYDPYFLYPPLGKTFAELLPERKSAVSHRGVAFRKLLDYLCSLKK